MKNINCKNVLFINYGGIGDEILFLPALAGFKKLYPDAKITLCLEKRASSIKTLTPLIDDIITVDIKACGIKKYFNILKLIISLWFCGFDTVISSGKSPFVSLILFLSMIKTKIGYKTKTSKLLTCDVELNQNCYAGKMYFDLIEPFIKHSCKKIEFELPEILYDKNFELPENVIDNDFILIHPGVSLMSIKKGIFKCPDAKFWIDLIEKLLDENETVLLAGGPDDKDVIDKILKSDVIKNKNFYSMYNKTKNLYQMAGLIKKCKRIICVDSAPLHLATYLNAKITVLFGPTNEKKLVYNSPDITVIKKELKCRPCLWDKRNTNCENSDCIKFSLKDINCMK